MIPTKPYVPKPHFISERDNMVLETLCGFTIWVFHNRGENVYKAVGYTREPEQCVAAIRHCKEKNLRCLVYGIGQAYGDTCLVTMNESMLLAFVGRELPCQIPS